jgi:hypothetical protein
MQRRIDMREEEIRKAVEDGIVSAVKRGFAFLLGSIVLVGVLVLMCVPYIPPLSGTDGVFLKQVYLDGKSVGAVGDIQTLRQVLWHMFADRMPGNYQGMDRTAYLEGLTVYGATQCELQAARPGAPVTEGEVRTVFDRTHPEYQRFSSSDYVLAQWGALATAHVVLCPSQPFHALYRRAEF